MDPLAIVRQNFAAFQARDFDAVLKHIDEDWRYVPGPFLHAPGTRYQGHDGYRAMLKSGGWRDREFEVDVELSRVDRYVLAAGSMQVEDPQGTLASYPLISLNLLIDGRIRSSHTFAKERDALAAVTLTADEDFRMAFDAAPDAMALLDDRGRIAHGNRLAADLLATPQGDLRGIGIEQLVPPEFRNEALEAWEEFRRVGHASGVGSLISADGSRRLVEYRATTNYVMGRHLVIWRSRDGGGVLREGEPSTLTPRQREVLSLLAFGLNGPETATRLFLSPATVRTHVQNAMHALGAKTRAQAVAEALIRGEIDLHPPASAGSGASAPSS